MLNLRKNSLLFIMMIALILLTGCLNKQTPIEKMYEVLEKVVSTEKLFEEQQDPLVLLEKKEKDIYEKIISLGMKEAEEIAKLSDEALVVIEERKEHMKKEQESIEASKKEFETLSPLIEELDKPDQKEKAEQLYEIMMERYSIYEEQYEYYTNALRLDKELYEMFKEEDPQIDQLQEQITKINEEYNKLQKANERFNEKTKQYNDLKLSFYKYTGIEVNVEDGRK